MYPELNVPSIYMSYAYNLLKRYKAKLAWFHIDHSARIG